jgi:hypothetical protein
VRDLGGWIQKGEAIRAIKKFALGKILGCYYYYSKLSHPPASPRNSRENEKPGDNEGLSIEGRHATF